MGVTREELSNMSSVGNVGIKWEWSFGPAYCGSWGGVWERMVGIVKHSFKACINKQTLDTDSFDALCSGTAGVVNRRPLTRASNSLEEMIVFIFCTRIIKSLHLLLSYLPSLIKVTNSEVLGRY